MNCPKCGVEINPEQVLCVKCGYPIKQHSKKNGCSKGCFIALGVSALILVLFIIMCVIFARDIFFGFTESIYLMDAVSNVQNIYDSQTRYYLENNQYATDFSQLNFHIPHSNIQGNTVDTNNYVYEIDLPYIKAIRKDNSKFKYTFSRNVQTNETKCEGDESICKTIYKTKISITTESRTISTGTSTYRTYYNKVETFYDDDIGSEDSDMDIE